METKVCPGCNTLAEIEHRHCKACVDFNLNLALCGSDYFRALRNAGIKNIQQLNELKGTQLYNASDAEVRY